MVNAGCRRTDQFLSLQSLQVLGQLCAAPTRVDRSEDGNALAHAFWVQREVQDEFVVHRLREKTYGKQIGKEYTRTELRSNKTEQQFDNETKNVFNPKVIVDVHLSIHPQKSLERAFTFRKDIIDQLDGVLAL
jgi:hypothetical protein